MKLGEVANLIRDAYVRDAPTAEVVRWIDRLRTRGWPPMVAPFGHKDLLALMRNGGPVEQTEWDAFLAKCDALDERVSSTRCNVCGAIGGPLGTCKSQAFRRGVICGGEVE